MFDIPIAKLRTFSTLAKSTAGALIVTKTSNPELETKLYESFIQAIQNAINFCFLLNGGAAIAILTFMGNFKDNKEIVGTLSATTMFFSWGVIVATISALILYVTQFSYYKEYIGERRPFFFRGTVFRIVLLICILVSTLLFAYGMFSASKVFS